MIPRRRETLTAAVRSLTSSFVGGRRATGFEWPLAERELLRDQRQVLAQLGRNIAGGLQTTTLNLAPQGMVYPDRLNTVDMRVSKILRIGRVRTKVGIDLYNLFNSNTGTGFNQNFGADGSTWLRPNAILNPRYARVNATVDF